MTSSRTCTKSLFRALALGCLALGLTAGCLAPGDMDGALDDKGDEAPESFATSRWQITLTDIVKLERIEGGTREELSLAWAARSFSNIRMASGYYGQSGTSGLSVKSDDCIYGAELNRESAAEADVVLPNDKDYGIPIRFDRNDLTNTKVVDFCRITPNVDIEKIEGGVFEATAYCGSETRHSWVNDLLGNDWTDTGRDHEYTLRFTAERRDDACAVNTLKEPKSLLWLTGPGGDLETLTPKVRIARGLSIEEWTSQHEAEWNAAAEAQGQAPSHKQARFTPAHLVGREAPLIADDLVEHIGHGGVLIPGQYLVHTIVEHSSGRYETVEKVWGPRNWGSLFFKTQRYVGTDHGQIWLSSER